MNPRQRVSLLAALLLGGTLLAAYANTFRVPFTFDDVSSVMDNPTILQLWPPWKALSPPERWGFTVSGRPLLNFSLALNYAISGFDVWSYHALNLLIHFLAALTLFGLMRRTFTRPVLADRFGEKAWPLALVITAVWALHPLQTEAVTYMIQRAESLMGLFFLLTIYGFVRSVETERGGKWQAVAVVSCLLGVATKEIPALAPIVVFLYDRTFVSGSFAEAWRRHRWRHLSLLATWVPLLWLLLGTGGDRGGTFHFRDGKMWVGHALTQFEAVTRYVGLTFWPHPQVFDYGEIPPPPLGVAAMWAFPLLVLLTATIWALWHRPVAGFLGACFFLILAPTSALPATLQIIVEHRMYLPLAAVLPLVFGAAALLLELRTVVIVGALVALAVGCLTRERNEVYRSGQALWEDNVAKRPENARALNNLGLTYYNLGRVQDSIPLYEKSRRLDPTVANTHFNLGLALMTVGRDSEAVPCFEEAVRILPYFSRAHLKLGIILMKLGREPEAVAHFQEAARYDSAPAEILFQYGVSLEELGRWDQAADQYAKAVQLDPKHAEAQSHWGTALFHLNAAPAAIEHFNAALRLKPGTADVHYNFGLALTAAGRPADAMSEYEEAIRLDPTLAGAQLNLGIALGQAGNLPGAIAHLQEAVRLRPDDARAQYNAGYAFLAAGRGPEAIPYFQNALRLQPGYAAARDMLRRLGATPLPPP
ncbi:MAG TPA: tetratricopeptide repeat protein [Opitutaceae bacterium]|nr:tetratricopeptide repeat protein [Opitutaceae bacterium]